MTGLATLLSVAQGVADAYALLPEVRAVALGGSVAAQTVEYGSDIDVYVYADPPVPITAREAIAHSRASRYAVDNNFWGPGDEWIEVASGVEVDVMHWTPGWIEAQLDRVLVRHEAATGYTTCFWHTVLHSQPLFDRDGWFGRLQVRARQPYPEALRRAIIAQNYPILRDLLLSAYLHQIEKAIARQDRVSVNHRVAALVASYFDVLFALNRLPHPGEKKLIRIAEERCDKLPINMRQQMDNLLQAAGTADAQINTCIHALVDNLDVLLLTEGLIASKPETT